MDEETVIGIQKMREEKKNTFENDNYEDVCIERDAYKDALESILRAHTVGRMIEIASKVLQENRKWSL